MRDFDELVAGYGKLDEQVKSLKKLQDGDKEEIKNRLVSMGIDTYSAGGYTVKRTVSSRESLDEEKALELLKADWILQHGTPKGCPYIKVREYLDLSELENAIYTKQITPDILQKLDSCREITTVITLKCTKKKEKE